MIFILLIYKYFIMMYSKSKKTNDFFMTKTLNLATRVRRSITAMKNKLFGFISSLAVFTTYFVVLILFSLSISNAAFSQNVPQTLSQSDGSIFECIASREKSSHYLCNVVTDSNKHFTLCFLEKGNLSDTHISNIVIFDDSITIVKGDPTIYTITFNLNGGEGIDDTIYTIESDSIILPIPTKIGYNFLGWFDNEELDGIPVTEISSGSTGDKEFWAKWEPTIYTITFNLNGGEGSDDTIYTIESETITLSFPTRTFYNFLGWFDNEELDGIPITEISSGSTGDKEFWAKWDPI